MRQNETMHLLPLLKHFASPFIHSLSILSSCCNQSPLLSLFIHSLYVLSSSCYGSPSLSPFIHYLCSHFLFRWISFSPFIHSLYGLSSCYHGSHPLSRFIRSLFLLLWISSSLSVHPFSLCSLFLLLWISSSLSLSSLFSLLAAMISSSLFVHPFSLCIFRCNSLCLSHMEVYIWVK